LAKPLKNRYDKHGVYINGFLISRAQTFDISADLGDDEVRELTNAEVVEYSSQTPQVTANLETNEYGSCRNIRAIAGITGGSAADNVTVNSFDGSTAEICLMIATGGGINRTAHITDASLTSVSWNFEVGGVGTETFGFESDNLTWYANTYRESYAVPGYSAEQHATLGTGNAIIYVSGFGGGAPIAQHPLYLPIKVYVDGVAVTGTITATGLGNDTARLTWTDSNFTSIGTRYKVLISRTGEAIARPSSIPNAPSTSNLGSIPRGKIDIALATGIGLAAEDAFSTTTDFLRLQSVSIDADLSREVLNELGHYRAIERSLNLPVPVNCTFSALASDLQDWAKLSGQSGNITANSYAITDFSASKTARLQVRIYDKNDTVTDGSRTLKKSITVTGLQVTAVGHAIDVGSNANADFTAKGSNFLISGVGTPGKFPILAVATD